MGCTGQPPLPKDQPGHNTGNEVVIRKDEPAKLPQQQAEGKRTAPQKTALKLQHESKPIVEVLTSPTQFEFVETPLSHVVDYVADLHHIEIQVDRDGLRAAGIKEV
jgi:hypothetical protein